MLLGATSLASCSNYELHRTAVENKTDFGEAAASAPHHNFYVDDLLNSIERRPRFSQTTYERCHQYAQVWWLPSCQIHLQ